MRSRGCALQLCLLLVHRIRWRTDVLAAVAIVVVDIVNDKHTCTFGRGLARSVLPCGRCVAKAPGSRVYSSSLRAFLFASFRVCALVLVGPIRSGHATHALLLLQPSSAF